MSSCFILLCATLARFALMAAGGKCFVSLRCLYTLLYFNFKPAASFTGIRHPELVSGSLARLMFLPGDAEINSG